MSTTMPTTGELYVKAMESTRGYINGVKTDQWHGSTPCSEWDVKQVTNHIIGENLWAAELFQGKTIAEVGNRLDGDLVQACLPIVEQLTTQFRSAGVYGEDRSVGAEADPQTKLLALVGRRA